MMEIPNRNFSNNQRANDVDRLQQRYQKIKVFLQRVEQKNNQITQNQKNIGTKKQQYTHLKKDMFYM